MELLSVMYVLSAPLCTLARAAIMTRKYGAKTGVTGVPGTVGLEHQSLFLRMEENNPGIYANAVIGIWHLSSSPDLDHPSTHGIQYYTGSIGGAVRDFFDWAKVTNGISENLQTYVTTDLTNEFINWINNQNQPWFLWLAHNVPHSPFHNPTENLISSNPE